MTFPFNSMILNRLVFPFLFNCHTCNTNDVCKLLCLNFFFINSKAVCVSKYLLRLVDDSWIHVQFFIKRYGVPSFCFVLAFLSLINFLMCRCKLILGYLILVLIFICCHTYYVFDIRLLFRQITYLFMKLS